MSDKTLTRMDLSEAVFREVGLSRNESAQLVETVLQHILSCDVERSALLKEMEEIVSETETKAVKQDKK